MSFKDWIKNPIKTFANASIIWQVLIRSFPRIGNWLAYRVGDNKKVRLGLNPWMGYVRHHLLPQHLVIRLNNLCITILVDVANPMNTNMWLQGRKKAEVIGFEGIMVEQWMGFTRMLPHAHIRLRSKENSLVWSKNPSNGKFTTKLGKVVFEEGNEQEVLW
jgi:hypothetical protein